MPLLKLSDVLLNDELFDVGGVKLVSLVFRLDHKTVNGGVHSVIETCMGLIHGFLLGAKVDARNLLQICDEVERLGRYHLVVSGGELHPRITQDILG